MRLRNHDQMEVNKIYHLNNMEIRKTQDGMLWSHYPEFEKMWHPFSTNDKWFEKLQDKELIEGPFNELSKIKSQPIKPKCFEPEKDICYPLCVGCGEEKCTHCCLWTDWTEADWLED